MTTRDELLREAAGLREKGELTEVDLARVDEIVDMVGKMDAAEAARKAASEKLAGLAAAAPKVEKAAAQVAEVQGRDAGERFILSPEWAALKSRFAQGLSASTDSFDVTVGNLVGKAAVANRAGATTGGSAFHLGSSVDDEVRALYGPILSAVTTGATSASVIPYRALTAVSPGPAIKKEAATDADAASANTMFPLATMTSRAETATTTTIGEAIPVTDEELADDAIMQTLVGQVLMALVYQKIESEIVSGTATNDSMRGIVSATGVQTQAFATDIITSIRKGLTKLAAVGTVNPVIYINSADLETLDMTKTTAGAFIGSGPFGAADRTLWGHPLVEVPSLPANTAIVGDLRGYEVYYREAYQAQVFSQHSDYALRGLSLLRGKARVIGVFRNRKDVCVVTTGSGS